MTTEEIRLMCMCYEVLIKNLINEGKKEQAFKIMYKFETCRNKIRYKMVLNELKEKTL